ncbi:MAG: YdcF family protein [Polyangiaceae bacterium]
MLAAIVVLGCAVRLGADGRLRPGALERRLEAALRARATGGTDDTVFVVSGGRRWGESLEADVMARELASRGVAPATVVCERSSLSTLDNARFSAAILERRGIVSAAVVTCAWHLPRALEHFARSGIDATGFAAPEDRTPSTGVRLWRESRERVVGWFELPRGPARYRRLEGKHSDRPVRATGAMAPIVRVEVEPKVKV